MSTIEPINPKKQSIESILNVYNKTLDPVGMIIMKKGKIMVIKIYAMVIIVSFAVEILLLSFTNLTNHFIDTKIRVITDISVVMNDIIMPVSLFIISLMILMVILLVISIWTIPDGINIKNTKNNEPSNNN